MSDLVRVVEAAYTLESQDENAWLGNLANVLCSELAFRDGAVAYSFSIRDDGWITPHAITVSNASPEIAADLLNPGAFPEDDRSSVIETHMTSGVSLATRIGSRRTGVMTKVGRDYFQRVLVSRGFEDALTLNATDPTRTGCLFFVPVKKTPHLGPRVVSRYAKLATHIAAGRRLRQALGAAGEAVLDSNGKVVDATGEATSKSARDALRDAARAVDRARGKLRRKDPEEALSIWKGLVSGRWSLVDRFESDGRRYIVAHPNGPTAPDPRALTLRERQVAGFVALGQSNKLIAYELGISASTVGVLAARAARKLGARTRSALAAMFIPHRPQTNAKPA